MQCEHVGEYQGDGQHRIPVEDVLDHETVYDEDGDRAAGERPAHGHRQEDRYPVASLKQTPVERVWNREEPPF